MGTTGNPLNEPGSQVPPTGSRRQWSWDDFFVAGLAVVCIPTAIWLICVYPNHIPPILPAVLLATGLAALTYRFLGGLEGAGFQMYGFKAAGGLAALALITYGINYFLQTQDPDTQRVIYTISGSAIDDQKHPVRIFDTDFSVDPLPVTVQKNGIGSFTVELPEETNSAIGPNRVVASIRIIHLHCSISPDDRPADIEQCYKSHIVPVTLASEAIPIPSNILDPKSRTLPIGTVLLNNQAEPSKELKQVALPPPSSPAIINNLHQGDTQ